MLSTYSLWHERLCLTARTQFLAFPLSGVLHEMMLSMYAQVLTNAASNKLFEFCPFIGSCLAARPSLLQIVEDWLSRMESASCSIVLAILVILVAAWSKKENGQRLPRIYTSCTSYQVPPCLLNNSNF